MFNSCINNRHRWNIGIGVRIRSHPRASRFTDSINRKPNACSNVIDSRTFDKLNFSKSLSPIQPNTVYFVSNNGNAQLAFRRLAVKLAFMYDIELLITISVNQSNNKAPGILRHFKYSFTLRIVYLTTRNCPLMGKTQENVTTYRSFFNINVYVIKQVLNNLNFIMIRRCGRCNTA